MVKIETFVFHATLSSYKGKEESNQGRHIWPSVDQVVYIICYLKPYQICYKYHMSKSFPIIYHFKLFYDFCTQLGMFVQPVIIFLRPLHFSLFHRPFFFSICPNISICNFYRPSYIHVLKQYSKTNYLFVFQICSMLHCLKICKLLKKTTSGRHLANCRHPVCHKSNMPANICSQTLLSVTNKFIISNEVNNYKLYKLVAFQRLLQIFG